MVNNLKFFSELGGGTSELSRLAEGYKPLSENEMNKPLTLENCKTDSFKFENKESVESGNPIDTPREGLTDEEKNEIKEKTGWSDQIVDAIRSKEEAQIYIDAGLVEGEINGKPALLQPNIDGGACNDAKWPEWSNKDLAEEGYPPRDEKGRPYELHHIGQNPDSPLAELTFEQHHCNGNFKTLHTFEETSIDRIEFNKERDNTPYWSHPGTPQEFRSVPPEPPSEPSL